MLMALGQFVFEIGSAPYRELSRQTEYRHEETARFGARPASQYVGPGGENVNLTGAIFPGLAGTHSAIETLRQMAGTGEAQPLVDGDGNVHGDFVILSIDETRSEFIDTGAARKSDFTISLRRTA